MRIDQDRHEWGEGLFTIWYISIIISMHVSKIHNVYNFKRKKHPLIICKEKKRNLNQQPLDAHNIFTIHVVGK